MRVVITGGTSGIGLDTAEKLKAKGHEVIIISLKIAKQDKYNIECDVSDEEQVKHAYESIKKNFGTIDVLINNAGFGLSGAMELSPSKEVQKMIDVNLMGKFYNQKYALPILATNGKIINTSSASAIMPLPYRGMYAASKAAVLAMTYALRMELSETKIQVCAICPGEVKTNYTKNRLKYFETNERYGNRIEIATNKKDSREERRMPVGKVSKILVKYCEKKKLPAKKVIGGKYKVLNFLVKIFPISWMLKFDYKTYGK